VLESSLRRDKYAANIDVEDAVEFLELCLLEGLGNGHAGIVHEHIDSAELRNGLFDRSFVGSSIGRVGLNCDGLSAGLFNFFDYGRGGIRTLCVGDGYAGSIFGQPLSDRGTNPA